MLSTEIQISMQQIRGNQKKSKTRINMLKPYYWLCNFCPTACQLIVVYFTYSLYLFIFFRTIVVITIFSQYLKQVKVPLPTYSRQRGMHVIRFPLFRLFPVSWVRGDWDLFKRPYNSAWLWLQKSLCTVTWYLGMPENGTIPSMLFIQITK